MNAPTLAPFPPAVADRIREGAFVLLDKPRGPTSHQVTAWAREILGVPTAGHAGTLDPNVSGLLWIGFGPALKILPLLLEFPKRYVGVVRLHGPVAPRDLERVVGEFIGPIFQTPPVRSAVRRARRVRTIHRLAVLERDQDTVLIEVVGDSGTYVRTLAVDIGEALGVDAHLEELRRTGTGPFVEAGSVTLPKLADAVHAARAGAPELLLTMLHPIEEVTREFPSVIVKDSAASAIAHGSDLAAGGIVSAPRPFGKGRRLVLLSRTGALLATGVALVDREEITRRRAGWVVDAERVFVTPASYPPTWGRRGPKPRSTASAGPRDPVDPARAAERDPSGTRDP
ncbi:MAG TPA: RNA-guided pseudouridylation complex pseudouridine synthase subunit Cbf5 [Thermoplasmata archaeon]|nr:RNA-guided pseudouridylation complex pseudouridine synthase subunit Cbf5 [Thermoplasmata archaeon]